MVKSEKEHEIIGEREKKREIERMKGKRNSVWDGEREKKQEKVKRKVTMLV